MSSSVYVSSGAESHERPVRAEIVAAWGAEIVIGRRDRGVERGHFQRLDGGKHLGDAGDRDLFVGIALGEHIPGGSIDHDVPGELIWSSEHFLGARHHARTAHGEQEQVSAERRRFTDMVVSRTAWAWKLPKQRR